MSDLFRGIPDNPYLLLTPGPLSTSKRVRAAMLRDYCTWDDDYNLGVVQDIRGRLVDIATLAGSARATAGDRYAAVLMQGSGSFSVEACIGSAVPADGKLLIVSNGAYGARMAKIADALGIARAVLQYPETSAPAAGDVAAALARDGGVTHVALVHCETTTGILNPLEELAPAAKARGKTLIVDAMSSFGGVPIDMPGLGIDFLISSANKCIQGVPGFAFVIADKAALAERRGAARSLCLDLCAQWDEMDESGKWRFTSPTHAVRAFQEALAELEEEGGVAARHGRYVENHSLLVGGMRELGFETLLPDGMQSPFITSFLYPSADFCFGKFYAGMKRRGFVMYPGKLSDADTFRVGNIGAISPADVARFLAAAGAEIKSTQGCG
jgi:2-aminoethylphosphonate-pyruvate transaminase